MEKKLQVVMLPTNEKGFIGIEKTNNKLITAQEWDRETIKSYSHLEVQHLYFLSDEEIKEDWFIANNGVHKCIRVDKNTSCPFITLNLKGEEIGHFKTWRTKIILTTDQDLIKDGVQAIDDEFLHWFVKNPSCEYVTVCDVVFGEDRIWKKYIIIPKEEQKQHLINIMRGDEELGIYEEPKQETLEEAAERLFPSKMSDYEIFLLGAKEQANRMYSEKEVREIIKLSCEEGMFIQRTINDKVKIPYTRIKDFTIKMFEQFKKK